MPSHMGLILFPPAIFRGLIFRLKLILRAVSANLTMFPMEEMINAFERSMGVP